MNRDSTADWRVLLMEGSVPHAMLCGLQMLANGDRQKAREHFTACVDTGVCGWFEYNLVQSFPGTNGPSMPQWPDWIK